MGEKFKVKVVSSRCYTDKANRGHPQYKTAVECADPNLIQNCREPHFPEFAFDSPVAYTPGDEYDLLLRKPEINHAADTLSYAEAFFPGKPKIENQFLSGEFKRRLGDHKVENGQVRVKLADRGQTIANQRIKIEGLTEQVENLRATLVANQVCPESDVVIAHKEFTAAAHCETLYVTYERIKELERQVCDLGEARRKEAFTGGKPHLHFKIEELEKELLQLRCESVTQKVHDGICDLYKGAKKKIEKLEATIKHKDESVRSIKGLLKDEQIKNATLDEKLGGREKTLTDYRRTLDMNADQIQQLQSDNDGLREGFYDLQKRNNSPFIGGVALEIMGRFIVRTCGTVRKNRVFEVALHGPRALEVGKEYDIMEVKNNP